MNKLTLETFNELLVDSPIKPRLKKELRFVAATESLSDEDWSDSELLKVPDRSGNKGVLLISLASGLYIVQYELKSGIISSVTGKSQSVICDLCRTWQYGDKSASISFRRSKISTVTYLCCEDLRCSMHVRSKTTAAHTSRAQLREDMTIEERVARLQGRLGLLVEELSFEPVAN